MASQQALRTAAADLAPQLTALRQRLHRHPEIGLELPRTQQTLLGELDGLGLEISTGKALSSITAVLRGPESARATVLLRADMDGLPVTEASGVAFASEIDGAMHACGHDLHMAMLVGAARLLSEHREALRGDVVFMFQPGEEGWDGAGLMIDEGVLDASGRRADAAYGMHVMAAKYPRRTFGTRPGTLMAASDWLGVTVHGRGGHGSAPHNGRDPVTAAAAMVTALQTMVTRRFDIFDPVVVTVGSFHAGTRRNIIPDTAHFDATIRTFSEPARERIRSEAPRLCAEIAAAHGMAAEVEYNDEYPATVNDAVHAEFARQVVTDVFGDAGYRGMAHPEAGAEDFSRVLDAVPGCYLMLGAATGDPAGSPDNHSPRATFDDAVLPLGALLHAELAVRSLARDDAAAAGSAGPAEGGRS
ncbi:M20 metallopeptidase family protein [Actinacidiphila sp. ITFR-21]|uniref:M20 metallopeptidase family protein n=1 Tax=Actinacidiphila sp. ITFR-21 TaxID=3075199 RepID=UPI002889D324|nr:M20 family metallopeptidase [Streptomyces sp. ITFR-21]WNI15388.1 M20 family metallopeptidase [Streptomyces sp. ITFR-21]